MWGQEGLYSSNKMEKSVNRIASILHGCLLGQRPRWHRPGFNYSWTRHPALKVLLMAVAYIMLTNYHAWVGTSNRKRDQRYG